MEVRLKNGRIEVFAGDDEILLSHDYNGQPPEIAYGYAEYGFKKIQFEVFVKNKEDFKGPVVKHDGEEWILGALSDGSLVYFKRVNDYTYQITKNFQQYKYLYGAESFATKSWDETLNTLPQKSASIKVIPEENKIIVNNQTISFSDNIEITQINSTKYKIHQKTTEFEAIIDTKNDNTSTIIQKIHETAMLYYPVDLIYKKIGVYARPIASNYKGDWLIVLHKLFDTTIEQHLNKPNSIIRIREGERDKELQAPQGVITIKEWPQDESIRKIANKAVKRFFSGTYCDIVIHKNKVEYHENDSGVNVLRILNAKKVVFVFPYEDYHNGKTIYTLNTIEVLNKDEKEYSKNYIPAWTVPKIRKFEDLSDVDWKLGVHHTEHKDFITYMTTHHTIRMQVPFTNGIYECDPFDLKHEIVSAKEVGVLTLQIYKPEFCTPLKDVEEIRWDNETESWIYRSRNAVELRVDTTYKPYRIFYGDHKLTKEEIEVLNKTGCIDSVALHNL